MKMIFSYGFFVLIVLTSCKTTSLLHNENEENLRESMYFEEEMIADPFLDSLATNRFQAVILKKRLLPPPPPPPSKFKQVEGFRIQVFAATDSLQAQQIQNSLKRFTNDSVYRFLERGLYKVQLGDYLYRTTADSVRRAALKTGYNGAWVVRKMINTPADNHPKQIENNKNNTNKFSIQLAAYSQKADAETEAHRLNETFSKPILVKRAGHLYKLYYGQFKSKAEAKKYLQTVQKKGFSQAWVTKLPDD
jgi:hypothetical protein